MHRVVMRAGTAALLVTLVLLTGSASAVADDPSTLIASGEFTNDVSDALTDGEFVAWVYGPDSPATACNTLNAAPLRDPTASTSIIIARGAHFDLSGGLLVWLGDVQECVPYTPVVDPGVYGVDLASGQEFVVTTERAGAVAIAGRTVVWLAVDDAALRMRHLDDGQTLTLAEFAPGVQVRELTYDGERVSWVERTPSAPDRVVSLVPGQEPAQLLALPVHHWYDVQQGWLVWWSDGLLQARALDGGQQVTLAEGVVPDAVATDGRYVLWATNDAFTRATLHAYRLASGSRFSIVTYESPAESDTVGIRDASIHDGIVAWSRFGYPFLGTEIRAVELQRVLPSTPRPDPGSTDPHWTYYPETGHYLAWGFRDYWEAHGGLPVFGYPLTEEFYEHNRDTGREHTVQFTERQRFEWHPDLAGTPYEVLLGRLGAELLERQGRDWTTFPQADPSTPHYMEVTGHAIAPEFWDYWSSHGLDLGDPGVSFRESLALFGYPLSEPMVETNADGHTVLTQWFERAVFEWHPDNPEPWRVLLRRLGAEMMTERGWYLTPAP